MRTRPKRGTTHDVEAPGAEVYAVHSFTSRKVALFPYRPEARLSFRLSVVRVVKNHEKIGGGVLPT